MIRLMHNEIVKLINKKSFYIVTFIFILFCVLTNVVYHTPFDNYDTEIVDIKALEEENASLNLNSSEELLIYVENLTTIEIERLKDKYSSNIQEYLIDHFLTSYVYQMYEDEYILKNQELYMASLSELKSRISYVQDGNWKYFLEERISYLESRLNETDGIEKIRYERLLELANYRQEKNIPYDDNNYLHNSLDFLEENMVEYINLLNDDNLTSEEENRLEFLEEEMAIHEYVIENEQDILNSHTLRAVLTNFSGEFGLFILIYVIMVAGSIVSEEYQRGTIKNLLTKPFKRRTILSSKLLVVILFIPLIMLFMSLIEILIGGVILGFDSLFVPVVQYINGGLETYSVLGYLFSLLFASLPIYFAVGIFAFMLSTVTASTSAAITISFLFYLLLNVISNLAVVYDFGVFKFFVSLYWDFSYLVTGSSSPFGASISTSVLVILLYVLVMLCIAYVTFGKKDVKNI